MIDLSPMKGVRVDPERRIARAQAGVLLGELDRETQAFGLAVPSGIVTHTGVAGLTLGGGIGWIMRKHGLSVDRLRSVDLVTADGEFVKASADENAELFWGAPRRRRQLRHRHRVRVRLRPARAADPGRPGDLADDGLRRRAPLLPRLDRGGAGRPDDDHRPPEGAAAADHPGGAARAAGRDGDLLLGRRSRGGRAVHQAAARLRLAGRGRLRPEAVPRPPGDARPELRARALVLLQELRRRRADRRDHRPDHRALAPDRVAAQLLPDLADGRRGQPRRRGRDRLQRARRRASPTTSASARRTRKASSGSATGCGASGRRSSPGTRAST